MGDVEVIVPIEFQLIIIRILDHVKISFNFYACCGECKHRIHSDLLFLLSQEHQTLLQCHQVPLLSIHQN